MPELSFVIPPSMGARRATESARALSRFLDERLPDDLPVNVTVAESYPRLVELVVSGRADAAWAPPFVAGKLESMGARPVVRLVRNGASTFRTVVLCRNDRPVDLATARGLKVAWVDRTSSGGFLLPQAWLKAQRPDYDRLVAEEHFVASYFNALTELLVGAADLSVCYASSASAPQQTHGCEDIVPGAMERLQVLGYTGESPNDAVVVGARAPAALAPALEKALLAAAQDKDLRPLLKGIFGGEGFEPAPAGSYKALVARDQGC